MDLEQMKELSSTDPEANLNKQSAEMDKELKVMTENLEKLKNIVEQIKELKIEELNTTKKTKESSGPSKQMKELQSKANEIIKDFDKSQKIQEDVYEEDPQPQDQEMTHLPSFTEWRSNKNNVIEEGTNDEEINGINKNEISKLIDSLKRKSEDNTEEAFGTLVD